VVAGWRRQRNEWEVEVVRITTRLKKFNMLTSFRAESLRRFSEDQNSGTADLFYGMIRKIVPSPAEPPLYVVP
jgi:hypothetical protein